MICNRCGCNMQHTTVGWLCYNCQPKSYYSSGTDASLQKQLEAERERVSVLREALANLKKATERHPIRTAIGDTDILWYAREARHALANTAPEEK